MTKPKKIETKQDDDSFNRFNDFGRKLVSVPKEEIDRREREYQEQKKAKKEGKAKC